MFLPDLPKNMIIYLYGADSYRRREKLNEYIERYKEKYAGGAIVFDFNEEKDFGGFKDFCKSQSLFEVSKLGVVYGFLDLEKGKLKEFTSLIKENLENKDITLVLNSDKKPTKEFSFLLKKPVISHSFENLEGIELQKFLDLEIKKRKIGLDIDAKTLLLSAAKQSAWDIILELDKLALLDEKKITKKILERHIDVLPAVDIFSHLNRIRASRDIGSKLALLEDLFSSNNDPAMIFNMTAASPYLDKTQKIKMADYDAAVKMGKLEYEEVLLDMILG